MLPIKLSLEAVIKSKCSESLQRKLFPEVDSWCMEHSWTHGAVFRQGAVRQSLPCPAKTRWQC